MRFRLTPRSMTLDDFELYKFEFSENFSEFRRFRTQQQLNDCQRQRCEHVELEQFWHAFALRAFVSDSDSWSFLFVIREGRIQQRSSDHTSLLVTFNLNYRRTSPIITYCRSHHIIMAYLSFSDLCQHVFPTPSCNVKFTR